MRLGQRHVGAAAGPGAGARGDQLGAGGGAGLDRVALVDIGIELWRDRPADGRGGTADPAP
ncbi:hypothetical protein SALBM135S_09901 [Streptomyces alboniger]